MKHSGHSLAFCRGNGVLAKPGLFRKRLGLWVYLTTIPAGKLGEIAVAVHHCLIGIWVMETGYSMAFEQELHEP